MFLYTDGQNAHVSGIEEYRNGTVLAQTKETIAVKFPGQKYWWGRALGSHESNWAWASPQTIVFHVIQPTDKENSYQVEILLGWDHSRKKDRQSPAAKS